MATKVSIKEFLNYFAAHAAVGKVKAPFSPPAGQEGYSMGAVGQTATTSNLKDMAVAYEGDDWKSYYNRTVRWLGRRVWDCNGMAEGFYKDKTGTNINTKARYNYSQWCNPKSGTAADKSLSRMPQLPGVAVFSGNSSSTISHVGYLLCKYGTGPLDWYVVEAKGADYGVIITKLSDNAWRWWGQMTKYFEYDADVSWKPEKFGITGETVNTPAPAPAPSTPSTPSTSTGLVYKQKGGKKVSDDIVKIFSDAAKEFKVPVGILLGTCEEESNFRLGLVSSSNAVGPMQFRKKFAEDYYRYAGFKFDLEGWDSVRGCAAIYQFYAKLGKERHGFTGIKGWQYALMAHRWGQNDTRATKEPWTQARCKNVEQHMKDNNLWYDYMPASDGGSAAKSTTPSASTPPASTWSGTVKSGQRGDKVKAIQEYLNKNGFDCGKADGIFGSKTRDALKKWQKKNGLTADGIYGVKCNAIARLF